MTDGEASVVRLASAEKNPLDHEIFIHLSSSSLLSSSPLTVCAPAVMLVSVPYFSTQLAEPWIASLPHREVALECTPGSSPEDYLQCLRFLTSSPTSWPSLLLPSVSEVLRILPVADHLLFQDCWNTCMAVLASFSWSIEEEDAIRATISNLNMEPSSDMRERLDTSHDGAALEAMFHKMLSTADLEESFTAWCQKCLNHSSPHFAAAFHSIVMKVMKSLSAGDPIISLSREWYVLAKIILHLTDAQDLILFLVNSNDLLKALAKSRGQREHDAYDIFRQILEKVERRVILLSNLQRARLLKWSCSGNVRCLVKEGSHCHKMRLRLAETLPFSDPARMQVMKFHVEVLPKWIEQVSHRVSQMDDARLKEVCDKFEYP